jgi:membrane associated rhomboid family serine protease
VPYCYRHPNRETGLSCSECGRPICTECMTVAPVGLRCPDHSGRPQGVARVRRQVRRAGYAGTGALVTKALIAANVLVYLAEIGTGSGGTSFGGGSVVRDFALDGPDVANGGWWRLITAGFLHANILHIGLNMLVLVWLGAPVERYLGHLRYLALFIVSGLAGSAGALIATPTAVTVGASGAIFGVMGALLVIEYHATGRIAGQAFTLILINLLFSFTVNGISVGGHIGGLIGGILATLAMTHFERSRVGFGRPWMVGAAALVAVAAASIVISYWKVRGYA